MVVFFLLVMNNDNQLNPPKKPSMKDHALVKTMNTSKLLNEAIAAGNTDDIDKYNKAHHAAMKELIAECPYCDPDWEDVPNSIEAMRGYDIALGNPDPGIKYSNDFSYILLNTVFLGLLFLIKRFRIFL